MGTGFIQNDIGTCKKKMSKSQLRIGDHRRGISSTHHDQFRPINLPLHHRG